MRVIGGSLKGRRLKSPTWTGLRPTSDKLRETLFNILAPRIGGARVVDGYAGTGAIGIEALSRGASRVVFIEEDRRAQKLIAENLAHCGVSDGYAIIRGSVARALETFREGEFDLVLLDPPYDEAVDRVTAVLARAARTILDAGQVVLEHAKRFAPPDRAGRLARLRTVTSGDSAITIYAKPA